MCGYRLQRVWLAQAARVGGSLSCIAAEAVAALFMWGGRDDSSTLWRRVCTARYMRARGSGTCDAQRGGALPVRRHLGNAVNLFAIPVDASTGFCSARCRTQRARRYSHVALGTAARASITSSRRRLRVGLLTCLIVWIVVARRFRSRCFAGALMSSLRDVRRCQVAATVDTVRSLFYLLRGRAR